MKHIIDYSYFILESNLTTQISKIGSVANTSLPNEIKAFLDVIAFAEGTIKYPNNGYKTMFTGKQFDDYTDHPRQVISSGGYDSSASGRYQFLKDTWDGLMKGKEFTPKNQDEGAVKLLKQQKSYEPLLKGDLQTALYRSRNIWASFPYSEHNQGAWYAKTDKDKLDVLQNVYYQRMKFYNPSYIIPDNVQDIDIETLSAQEKSRVGSKHRGGTYTNDDTAPFVVGKSSGNKIEKLQTAIIKLGGSLPVYGIDGKFGNETMGASKFILGNLASLFNSKLDSVITDTLSENNLEVILQASENKDTVDKMIKAFGKSDYDVYSQNLPLIDGKLSEGGSIYNVNAIGKFINKLKNKQKVKIYHIGDSHIKADFLTNTIDKGLSSITKVDYEKNAEDGWTVNKHLQETEIESDLKKDIDLVIISLGDNDTYMEQNKFNSESFKSSYEKLIDKIKKANPNVEILATTPSSSVYPLNSQTPNPIKQATHDIVINIGASENVAVWDLFTKMGGVNGIKTWLDNKLMSDGLHFTKEGYRKLGNQLVADIKKYL